MAKCAKVCAGDLSRKIEIYTRALVPGSLSGSVDATESFTLVATVWAEVRPFKGTTVFDGIQAVRKVTEITHVFTIRFRTGLSTEHKIKYNGNYYDIVSITDKHEEHRFLSIDATLQGDTSKGASVV